jgi:hypothetical protein
VQIYSVSGASNSHQTLVLRDAGDALNFTSSAWGTELLPTWPKYHLLVAAGTRHLPASDLTSIYLPGLLVAGERATVALKHDLIESLPVEINGSAASVLNPQFTIHRFREQGATFLRVGSAVLLLQAANFYLEDLAPDPTVFWFHDGNFPRFLLCTERFVQQVRAARLSGLTFKVLGTAQ